jgi:transposase InsO family protein
VVALLHMDVKQLARFSVPGHRVTGDRRTKDRHHGIGYDYLHCVDDDHSRLAYVELHPREDAESNARTLERALVSFAELGLQPQAVITDQALVYRRSRRFRELLTQQGLRHIQTPPYTPRWNGKVERFIRTLQDEWAYAHSWPTSSERARALLSFVCYYNRRRPHSSLGDRPSISRVHNVCGQDT